MEIADAERTDTRVSAPPAYMQGSRHQSKQWPRYERAAFGLRNYWYPSVISRQLKKKPLPVKMLGEELVLVRDGGKVYCLQGRCAHRGVPLADGKFDFPGTITCAYHGWTYELSTGRLVAALTDGPESAVVGKVQIKTYPAQERQGIVWVFVGDGEPPPLEEDVFPELLEPGALVGARDFYWTGNWRIAMEGSVDPSHAYYLHRSAWLAGPYKLIAARGRHWPEVIDGRYFTYSTDPPVPEAEYPGLGRWPRQSWWRQKSLGKPTIKGALPGCALVGDLPFNLPFSNYSWYVPVDDKHYHWFTIMVAPASLKGPKRWLAWLKYWLWLRWTYQGQFLRQDSRMNEIMHPFYAEQNGWTREYLYRPDVVVAAWRKFIDKNARGIQEKPTF